MSECVRVLRPSPGGRQLLLLPFLGGYANSFNELVRHLPASMEVLAINPPGHGPCRREPLRRLEDMTGLYAKALKPLLRKGYILLGHSMGGLVSYALIDHLELKPSALILSGVNPPHVASKRLKRVSQLPFDELIAHLVSLGGIPDALVKERELLEFCLPSFRADFEVLETAVFEHKSHDIDAHVVYGSEDALVDTQSAVEWGRYFPNMVVDRMEGGHMFIKERPAELARYIESVARAHAL